MMLKRDIKKKCSDEVGKWIDELTLKFMHLGIKNRKLEEDNEELKKEEQMTADVYDRYNLREIEYANGDEEKSFVTLYLNESPYPDLDEIIKFWKNNTKKGEKNMITATARIIRKENQDIF